MSWLFIFVYLCWVQPLEIMMCEVPLGVDTDSMFVRCVLCSFILIHSGGFSQGWQLWGPWFPAKCSGMQSPKSVSQSTPSGGSFLVSDCSAATWQKRVSEIRITEIPAKFKVKMKWSHAG